ncbi:MAG: helicase-exonuclease AddAB subunit AddA [Lachnospiraceae bacterium]|nr:helicase-exonuclease AddAB subunit AddA [Lachnospiraceae bacterium]
MDYTKEQQNVINARGTNALVSAAAGSGKTAVIVERLIQRVIKDGINIDEILLVTFTKAAAAEMKDRIKEAFEKKLDETDPKDPSFLHVEKQFSLLFGAPIETIDSFCLDVIRNNFDVIDLDPSFRVADEGEIAMIRADVMDALMERHYSAEEDEIGFYDFLESFSVRKSDADITDAIDKIHDFAVSRPDPEGFINSVLSVYQAKDESDLKDSRLFAEADELLKSRLTAIKNAMERACGVAMSPGGPQGYLPSFEEDVRMLEELVRTEDFASLFEKASKASFSRLSTRKSPDEDKNVRETAKALRDAAKSAFDKTRSSFFEGTIGDILQELKDGKKDVAVLSGLTMEFLTDFREEKKKRALMDFSDLEHTALRILRDEKVQKRYRDRFREVMVDEYQDCNRIQEEIFKCVSNGNNLFCVGDVKQSIYSFRDACPDLFTGKYKSYEKGENGKLLLLSKNFRSRQAVINATNVIFRNIMHSEVGGVEYDKRVYLNYGDIYEHENPDDTTEYLLTAVDDESGLSQEENQALSVAKRIHELVGSLDIEDRKKKQVRKCRYGDIVIMMRGLSGYGDTYAQILSDNGIPVSLDNKSGYLFSDEIRTLINLLLVIDNPRQDIPLAGALLSVFGDLDESELALIRAASPDTSLYEALSAASENGNNKALAFLDKIEGYTKASSYLSMYELLTLIIKDHGYDNIVRAMKNGQLRLANLNMLLFRASEFENTSYKGLFSFIRYIEYMKKYDIDMKGPSEEDSEKDAVRIMTIHHSKGLEFPVVFVCGMHRQFNETDIRERLLTDDDLGIGADIIDLKRRTKKKTFVKKVISLKKKISLIGEELRILYVAMTRAEQKLILTAAQAQDGSGNGLQRSAKAVPAAVSDANSFGKLIDFAFSMDANVGTFIRKNAQTTQDLVMDAFEKAEDEVFLKKDFLLKAEESDDERVKEICDMISRDAVLASQAVIPEKLSVSFIKHEAMEEAGVRIGVAESEKNVPVPRFISGTDMDRDDVNIGAIRGSAYHAVFEHLDFGRAGSDEDVEKMIDELKDAGILDEMEAGLIDPHDIAAFGSTDLFRRMKEACEKGCLFREQPFVILVPASQIDRSYPDDQTVMVQGIIDAYFIKDGRAVIMDYKTDRVSEGEELVKKYRAQLDYYAKAIRQLTGMEVSGEIIYSVTLGEEIVIS